MNKIALNLDTLDVESFETSHAAVSPRGTVFGAGSADADEVSRYGCQSLNGTCILQFSQCWPVTQ